MVKELKRALGGINGNGQNEQGRHGIEGGYQITILHKDQEVKDRDSFQENRAELTAIYSRRNSR